MAIHQLTEIANPALVIGCADDVIHPLDMARTLAKSLPSARFVDVHAKGDDRARHAREVANAIGTFLHSRPNS
jgi:pimeloyl-ACP methyl ester carboxylesterase